MFVRTLLKHGSVPFLSALMLLATLTAGTASAAVTAAPLAYVCNAGDGTLSVINVATRQVEGTIQVGIGPAGVAVNSDGSLVYAANSGSNTVSVIDTATRQVVATVPVGGGPTGVLVADRPGGGGCIYATNSGDGTVSVIHPVQNQVVATIPVGPIPLGLAATPDGNRVYVATFGNNRVVMLDTNPQSPTNMTVVASIHVGNGPVGLAFGEVVSDRPGGGCIYAINSLDGTVSDINVQTNQVSRTLFVGGRFSFPLGLAAAVNGTRLYVATFAFNRVIVLDTTSGQILGVIQVGAGPVGVGLVGVVLAADRPGGGCIYATNSGDNTVSDISLTNQVLATIPVGRTPVAVAGAALAVP
jgi:YVTN family beta-propeller protein